MTTTINRQLAVAGIVRAEAFEEVRRALVRLYVIGVRRHPDLAREFVKGGGSRGETAALCRLILETLEKAPGLAEGDDLREELVRCAVAERAYDEMNAARTDSALDGPPPLPLF